MCAEGSDTLASIGRGCSSHPKRAHREACLHCLYPCMTSNSIAKRSLYRAVVRATKNGSAIYRGRWRKLAELKQMHVSNLPSSSSSPVRPPPARLGPRWMKTYMERRDGLLTATGALQVPAIRVLSWNSGGLAPSYEEALMQCTEDTPIVALQETRWFFDSHYETGPVRVIHSGAYSQDRACGVALLLHQSLCAQSDISFADLVPGRLLHIRIRHRPKDLDIVCAYQHAWTTDSSLQELCLVKRARFWSDIHRLLGSLLKRNCLVVLGDFNTSLHPEAGRVGSQSFHANAAVDQYEFQSLLKSHDLLAVTTWRHMSGDTFHSQQNTRLDYILCRRLQATALKYMGGPCPDLPMGTAHTYMYHSPVVAYIPIKPLPPPMRHPSGVHNSVDDKRLLQASKLEPSLWHACRQDLSTSLQELPDNLRDNVETLEFTLKSVAQRHFPKPPRHRPAPHWLRTSTSEVARRRWTTWRAIKSVTQKLVHGGCLSLQNAYYLWYQLTQQRRLTRILRQMAKADRQAFIQHISVAACEASVRHDMRAFYRYIRILGPKQPRSLACLRNPRHGYACTSQEKSQILAHHFKAVFWNEEDRPLQGKPLDSFPIEEAVLCEELLHLPLYKAAPRHLASSITWKCMADIMTPYVYRSLKRLWCVHEIPAVPQTWKDGWLTLIAKPHKGGSLPEHYRPIALQSHVGKATLKQIVLQLRMEIECHLRQLPQFAYLSGRDCYDCIWRFQEHAQQVRALADRSRRRLSTLKAQTSPLDFAGGLCVSIDLTLAFDNVSRELLARCLEEFNISPSLQALILAWHDGTNYHIVSEDPCTIPTSRGVRQGCVLAPLLWLIFLHMWVSSFAIVNPEVILSLLFTLFADDILIHQAVENVHEAIAFLTLLGRLLTALQEWGLKPNFQKTVILCHLRGRGVPSFLASYKTVQRGTPGFLIPMPDGEPVFIAEVRHTV